MRVGENLSARCVAGRPGLSRPAPGFPRSAPIGLPRGWAGRAGEPSALRPKRLRARSCSSSGGAVLAAGDAPGSGSGRGSNPGCSRGYGAELGLRDHRSSAGFGPSEAVSASFAPWAPRPAASSGAIGSGWAGESRRAVRVGAQASSCHGVRVQIPLPPPSPP